MGCKSSVPSFTQLTIPATADFRAVEERLSAFLDISSPSNVNNKYSYLISPIEDTMVGSGMFRTYAYESKVDSETLERAKREFWETRVEGQSEVWQALRFAVTNKDSGLLIRRFGTSSVGSRSFFGPRIDSNYFR